MPGGHPERLTPPQPPMQPVFRSVPTPPPPNFPPPTPAVLLARTLAEVSRWGWRGGSHKSYKAFLCPFGTAEDSRQSLVREGTEMGGRGLQEWAKIVKSETAKVKMLDSRELPGRPLVKIPSAQCRGHEFDPWLGNKDPTCCLAQP